METNQELVISTHGKPMTDSLKVAEMFHKEHKKVVKKIEQIIEMRPDLALSIQRGEFFIKTTYFDSANREQTKYLIDKQGYLTLVTSFQGEKSAKAKAAFIQSFLKMEEYIQTNSQNISSVPATLEDALQMALDNLRSVKRLELEAHQKDEIIKQKEEEKKILEADNIQKDDIIQAMKEKTDLADRLFGATTLFDIGEVAKQLQIPLYPNSKLVMGRNKLYAALREKGIIMKYKEYEPKQTYIDLGYFKFRMKPVRKPDQPERLVPELRVTTGGLVYLTKVFPQCNPEHGQLKLDV
jgi:anti-repressor protein